MTGKLEGKTFIVTGGFGNLGRAVGDELAKHGARAALLDRSEPTVAVSPGHLALGGVDLSDPQATAKAVEAILAQAGGVDGLVNVAGGFAWEKQEQGSIETWDKMYAVNLRTAVVASQAVLPHLLERGAGRIVNVGALASLKAGVGMAAYAASKAGVARLTEAMADELKDSGINVNAVLPSIIDTPANRADMPDADFSRWVTPQALAAVIAFLLMDESAPVTGACLPVGGRI